MSFALLFSGQGTQHPAMLPWLSDDARVRDTCTRLGVEHWRAALVDADWAARNDVAQTLLTGLALAAWDQLSPLLPAPSAVAGYSVGELAAFSAAGAIDADVAASLAPLRAAAMDRCAEREPGGLLALAGISRAGVGQLCAESGVEVAIRIDADSVIVGGPLARLDRAESLARAGGAEITRLRVNVASHTSWMRTASKEFEQTLWDVAFRTPQVPLFSNAADRIRDAGSARSALAAQIATTVCWDECLDNIAARGVGCVLEVGPGQALARMWNRRYPDVPARACDDFRSAASVAAWIASQADR